MGKYIKKTKGTGDVAMMEIAQGCLGVRTRAKTLALQRDAAEAIKKTAASYLQLRSRRLVKLPFHSKPPKPVAHTEKRAQTQEPCESTGCATSTKSNTRLGASVNSARSRSVSMSLGRSRPTRLENEDAGERETRTPVNPETESENAVEAVEASFGENMLDADARERSIRETTPCSLVRDSENLEAPGSTTRPTNRSKNHIRLRSGSNRSIPTAIEMEEFFADAERQQQTRFTDKYNYDPVNDLPLPGRYEWNHSGAFAMQHPSFSAQGSS